MGHFLLYYEVADDYLVRREPFRASHLQYARDAVAEGLLQLGGAYGSPVEGALLVFKSESVQRVCDFAESDPYVIEGVVTSWRVVPWTTVVGEGAAHPVV